MIYLKCTEQEQYVGKEKDEAMANILQQMSQRGMELRMCKFIEFVKCVIQKSVRYHLPPMEMKRSTVRKKDSKLIIQVQRSPARCGKSKAKYYVEWQRSKSKSDVACTRVSRLKAEKLHHLNSCLEGTKFAYTPYC
ncbi:hypothetical protein DPMN_168275 [Dreissena polymorpha]|uniref:Uncharacterized protein n=1 Tax=Dreissena polymorpha TaxID=45954 RepID=A0A9D4F5A6_DREPO|nr:hypothetical protein DPMN_168275 [Dreissena polymorpha]